MDNTAKILESLHQIVIMIKNGQITEEIAAELIKLF